MSNEDPDVPPEPLELEEEPMAKAELSMAEQLLGSSGSAEAIAPAPQHAEGEVLLVGGAKYRLVRRLGAGGMGEVFLARKLGTGGFERDVALKSVLPSLAGHRDSASFLRAFTDEARLAAHLNHPGICQVHDLQPITGRGLLMVLEYIPGTSLKDVIDVARKKRTALTEPFACYVAAELASALGYAHAATDAQGKPLGIVHRDVTPHNIMLATTGTVKLLDFGIAFSDLDNREATRSNQLKGKDEYYAPEQLLAGVRVDGRADQFALALCLYEMLQQKRFFKRGETESYTQLQIRISTITAEAIAQALAAAPIDDSLKHILARALAPAREDRFATCADFGDALRAFVQRRGWLYTAADAAKEVSALFALPDAPDAEGTTPSGKRRYSAVPRRVPQASGALPVLAPEAPGAPEASARGRGDVTAPSSPSAKPPSATAVRRRQQLQEELHNPKTSARKMLALPLAVLAGTILLGLTLVKLFVLSGPGAAPVVEVVKTPEQLRAEAEAAERAREPLTAPPALAPIDSAPAPASPLPSPPVADGAPPATAASPPKPRPHAGADAKAVDDLLAKQYGGRPTVTPDAPKGAVVPAGPRRRNLATPMLAEADAPKAPAGAAAGPAVPKGTVLPARLTAPADSSQPSPTTAIITRDVFVAGAVAVPKGTTVVCQTQPLAGRVGLTCDTLNLARGAVTVELVAMGADKRLGLPLSAATPTSPVGDIAKEQALTTATKLLGRVVPEGAAGDVVGGAADTATQTARSGQAPSQGPPPVLPAGTTFTLFVQQAF